MPHRVNIQLIIGSYNHVFTGENEAEELKLFVDNGAYKNSQVSHVLCPGNSGDGTSSCDFEHYHPS